MMKRAFPYFLFLLSCTGIMAQEIFPDTVKLKPVTIRAESKLKNMGMLTHKLDTLQLDNTSKTDLSEMLRDNTAVFIKQTVQGSTAGLSLRGTNSTHTRVVWNKIPLNSPMHGSTDISKLPFSFTDEVSILYSAASISHSDGALGGSLYLQNKPEWNKGIRIYYIGSAGSFRSHSNFLKLNFSNQKLSSSTRLYHAGAKNNFTYQNNSIIDGGEMQRENADFRNTGIMQSLAWRPADKHFIKMHAWAQTGERGVPGLITNESGSRNHISRQQDKSLRGIINYTRQSNTSKLEAWSAFNLENNHFTTENYISGLGQYRSIDSRSAFVSFYQGISSRFNINDKHRLEASIRHHLNKATAEETIMENIYEAHRRDIFISAEYEHSFNPNTWLVLLVKEDIIDNQAYTPNFATTFSKKIKEKLNLMLGVSKNTHHPSLNDLYFIPGGNPELKPESAVTTDAGVEFSIANGIRLDNTINMYYRQISDYILWRPGPQGYWQAENIPGVESAGLEYNLNVRKKLRQFTIAAHLSYALNRSVNKTSGEYTLFDKGGQLPYIPIHTTNISPIVLWRSWQLKYQWNFYSERFTTSSNSPNVLYAMYPYFMNDLHLSKSFALKNSSINLTFSIYNLFDESYRSVLWQPMPGINFRAGVQFQFR